jgi:phosphatidylserine/phosphatidylglycerophosphate/cardiolipin synthase-like enzyme
VFKVSKPLVCHVGPDAGWPTLKPFLEATEKTLSIAMYDFNADYIAKALIDLVREKEIETKLTWDNGMTSEESAIRKKLREKLKGHLDGLIVQCGSGRRFASAYHEKVAVRDSSAFWLSSGNWSKRSQPDIDPICEAADAKGMYSKGNREWHVIVEDKPLSKLFESYIEHDLEGSREELEAGDTSVTLGAPGPFQLPDVFVPMEALIAQALEASGPAEPIAPATLPDHGKPYKIQPLLTPDNYHKRIVQLLKSAKRSVYLQFAYINYSANDADKDFAAMLKVLAELSYKPGMDVRIIVGSNNAADKIRLLVENGFNEKVFRSQRNIHNKGILVDGKVALVSSANWSGDGVLRNRDAGLIIYDAQVAKYYKDIFLDDWDVRATSHIEDDPPVMVAPKDAPTPPGMARMSWIDYFG